ncbi:MAG: glutathione S-transferase N-terminal domain-containing protein [SAR324 cluster bacterium]|nr:glutathione S-transferase N-terminal domain-containing protein [SAR324 cluster bacterium]
MEHSSNPLIFKRWPPKHPERVQLYSMGTPNGLKISIALEETEIPYDLHLINIRTGDQHTEEFKSINPNSKIPVILDPHGPDGKMISIMESGAILIYLAEKSGKLMPLDGAGKSECLQWLFFQVGHIGPMFGQFGHFYKFAADQCKDPYPVERYRTESRRLLAILEKQLTGRDFLIRNEYTIADIATFSWVNTLKTHFDASEALGLSEFPRVFEWVDRCMARPASERGRAIFS